MSRTGGTGKAKTRKAVKSGKPRSKAGRKSTAEELGLLAKRPAIARVVGDIGTTALDAENARVRLLGEWAAAKIDRAEFVVWDDTLKSIAAQRQEREAEARAHERALRKMDLEHERGQQRDQQLEELRRMDAELDAKIAKLAYLEGLAEVAEGNETEKSDGVC